MVMVHYSSVVISLIYEMVPMSPDIDHIVSMMMSSFQFRKRSLGAYEVDTQIFERGTSKLCSRFSSAKRVLEGFTNAYIAGGNPFHTTCLLLLDKIIWFLPLI